MSRTISQRLFRHTAAAAFVAAFLLGAIWMYFEYRDVHAQVRALDARLALVPPAEGAPSASERDTLLAGRKGLEDHLSLQALYVAGFAFLAMGMSLFLVRGFPRRLEREVDRAQAMVRGAAADAVPPDVRELGFPELAELVQPVDRMARELRSLREQAECLRLDAAEARRAKDEFLANVSHELRTPLNGAMGLLQLLQLNHLSDEQKTIVEQALSCNQALVSVLNDILDVSSVEKGQLVINSEPFSLDGILDLVRATFADQARVKNLTFGIETDDSVPGAIKGDSVRLRQILFHLVGNAVKFTETGGVTLTVTRLPGFDDATKVRLLFVVSDTGIGIPDDKITEAFDVFTQVDGSLDRAYTGIGIGLGLVRMLASLMGGILEVSTEVGKGTDVYLRLDFDVTEDEVPAPERHEKSATPGTLAILLAEDNAVNQIFVRRMLSRIGHRVVTAANGREVLDALEKEIFDCILMDIQMPVMDGLEATRRIRAGESAADPDIPIIALTAHVMPEEKDKIMAAGVSAYVPKPVEFANLLAAMGRVL